MLLVAIAAAIGIVLPLVRFSLHTFQVPPEQQGVAAMALLVTYLLFLSPVLALLAP